MKVCQKCGAYNSDERVFCVDCNERLSDKINSAEQKVIEDKIDANIEKLYNKKDPLYVSVFDKIIGFGCIVFSLLLLILGVALMFKDRGSMFPFTLIIFGIIGALDALLPQLGWELEKLSLSFRVNDVDDLTPSSFYLSGRRIAITVCLIICIIGAVFTAKEVVHPPVIQIADTLSYSVVDGEILTVEEIKENFPKEWDEIISGGGYTVYEYLGHLKKSYFIGERERILIEAIIEIRDLDMDSSDYNSLNEFIMDYEHEMQLKNHK